MLFLTANILLVAFKPYRGDATSRFYHRKQGVKSWGKTSIKHGGAVFISVSTKDHKTSKAKDIPNLFDQYKNF